jgi:hypothetical protein
VYRYLTLPLAVALFLPGLAAADDTPKAAATRKKLDKKVTVEYKDTLFRDVMDDLKDQADVTFLPDTKNGVNLNLKVTYKAKDKSLEDVLNAVSDKAETGWYIISNKVDGYDGSIRITRSKERGYKAGTEPDKTASAPKEKPDKTKPATKEPAEKPKPAAKDNPDKTTKPEEDADETERVAGRRLKLAKELQDDGKAEKAHDVLQEIVKKYPKTKAAEEAQKLLKDEK